LIFIVNDQYAEILTDDIKRAKRKLKQLAKEGSVDELADTLKKYKYLKDGIKELFFKDVLNLGPFSFKVGLLKSKLIETLTDLDKYLMEHME
jgi:hypothetical protein